MAINRLTRDGILLRALDKTDSPTLDQKDRPSGTIVASALSIGWLQEGLDYFYKKFPWGGTIVKVAITISENAVTVTGVPSDFIQDYKNGIKLDDDKGRMRRRGLSKLIGLAEGTTASPIRGTPKFYTVRGQVIETRPKANKLYTGNLWYYQLPAALADTTIPTFPDDLILVDFVWLRAEEWLHKVPVGTALKFADEKISELMKSGLGLEAEEDQMELDTDFFGEQQLAGPTDWMGKPNL